MTGLQARDLPRTSAVDALVKDLRDQILDGKLPPGEVIKETHVADIYRVSRPTAKAAIRDLVSSRILRQAPNSSAVVMQVTADDIEDLFLARKTVELEVIRRIIVDRHGDDAATTALPAEAVIAVREMESIVGVQVPAHEFVRIDLRFHRALAEFADSDFLLSFFDAFEGQLHLSMLQSYRHLDRAAIAHQHADILRKIGEALSSPERNWKPARDAMLDHLTFASDNIAAALQERLAAAG
jgi:DNA-binding GntR family transcriptional regulator